MLVNKHSDFLALDFLTGVDVMVIFGLLYVTPSGFDNIKHLGHPLGFVRRHTYLHGDIYFYNVHTFVFKRRKFE